MKLFVYLTVSLALSITSSKIACSADKQTNRDSTQHPTALKKTTEVEFGPLDSPEKIAVALTLAQELESSKDKNRANALYVRLAKVISEKPTGDSAEAAICEGAARTKINLISHDQVSAHDLLQSPQFISGAGQLSKPYAIRFNRGYVLVNVLTRSIRSMTLADLQEIDSLLNKALAIRSKLKTDKLLLSSDLLLVGALTERKGKPTEATSFYLQALDLDSETSWIVAQFFSRNPEIIVANQVESQLIDVLTDRRLNSDTQSNRLPPHYNQADALVQYMLTHKEAAEGIKLFKKTVKAHGLATSFSTDTILDLVKVMQSKDLQEIDSYLEFRWKHLYPTKSEFLIVMRAMADRGWKSQTYEICDAIERANSSPEKIDTLCIVEQWYAKSNNSAKVKSTRAKILSIIKERHGSDQQALDELVQLKDLLNSGPMQYMDLRLMAQIHELAIYHKDRLAHRKYLDQAKQLNDAAFKLEKNDQCDQARKLYQQALEIKQQNLPPSDPEIATQMINLARVASEQKQYSEAERFYETALVALKKNPDTDPSDIIAALESYGQMLNDSKQKSKATKIYDEARVLARKNHRK